MEKEEQERAERLQRGGEGKVTYSEGNRRRIRRLGEIIEQKCIEGIYKNNKKNNTCQKNNNQEKIKDVLYYFNYYFFSVMHHGMF